ncbi:MAG: hypothetical protein QM612_03740 [Thermomonas sp.]|uniref:hypothetical protein n=1 Tax=Thermomonas sp. TaxID=1971895 RepID=UPI0039E31096
MHKNLVLLGLVLMVAACNPTDPSSNKTAAAKQATDKPSAPKVEPRVARAEPVNAMPLGLELGYSNLEGAEQVLGVRPTPAIVDTDADGIADTNADGVVYEINGNDLNIEGLQKAMLIYDPEGNMQAAMLLFSRGNRMETKEVGQAIGTLSSKYHRVRQNYNSFMDFGSAVFEQGDSWVHLDAPHVSDTMLLTYTTKTFRTLFENNVQAQADQANDRKQNAL